MFGCLLCTRSNRIVVNAILPMNNFIYAYAIYMDDVHQADDTKHFGLPITHNIITKVISHFDGFAECDGAFEIC